MLKAKDFTVIIRSVGERTTPLAANLLKQVFNTNEIHIVNASPFTETLHQTFALGIKQNKKWTVCVDGDVLVARTGVEKLLASIDKLEDDVFEIQGHIFDKLFGIDRPAGLRCYRTSLLPLVDSLVPSPENALRPESQTYFAMAEKGYRFVQTTDIVGLHDFEQSYKDLFRTAYIHGKKHAMFADTLIPYWKRFVKTDKDYEIALIGYKAGLNYKGVVSIDTALPNKIEKIFSRIKITEKKPLAADALKLEDIQNIIDSQVLNTPMKFALANPPKPFSLELKLFLQRNKQKAFNLLRRIKRKLKKILTKQNNYV